MADRGSASTDSGPGNGARDRPPCVLSIAGSDSGGGAGIQADLKAFAACGVHGMTAITALTAQNTVGVSAVEPVSPEMIVAQVAAVADDIGVDAVKIGMLGTVGTIEAVAAALDLLRAGTPVVLDPVMVSESGAELLEVSARGALMELLLPRVTVVTPNLPEARALMAAASARASPAPPGAAAPPGAPAPAVAPAPAAAAAPDAEDVGALARALRELGPQVVVVTGGHREQAIDVFFDGAAIVELPGERYPSGAAHGSGCTHSS
ncbi:MAG: bifunctional hydroxymethylpyrimidine kinase/phosphomethylpyrimidine kinase, partial [Solirubrobacteraceae bacterium]